MECLKVERNKCVHDKDRAEQENQLLKNAVQESFQLRQQMQSLENDMASCQAVSTCGGMAVVYSMSTCCDASIQTIQQLLCYGSMQRKLMNTCCILHNIAAISECILWHVTW